jgi:hypothetical protein
MKLARCFQQSLVTYQVLPGHRQRMLCHLYDGIFNKRRITRPHFRTVHDYPYILDDAVDYPKGLSRGTPSLLLRESVESLQDRLDVVLSLLEEFD